jgi:hypothetical protein
MNNVDKINFDKEMLSDTKTQNATENYILKIGTESWLFIKKIMLNA